MSKKILNEREYRLAQNRRRGLVALVAALLLIVGCALWPPQARSADARLYWTFPSVTTADVPVTEAYLDHFTVFRRVDAGAALLVGETQSIVTYPADGPLVPLRGLRVGTVDVLGLDARQFHSFAVASVDTIGRASALSLWSEPWRPADSDAGPPASPAAILVQPLRVW